MPYPSGPSSSGFYHACSFYTTFHPAFHSTELPDEDGALAPILDTGATRCLLPLKWLAPEQAARSKQIHLKVASGTSVRALLYQNLIYCVTVSRPLLSAGQLKGMLDLRFTWDDSAPQLVCMFRRLKIRPLGSLRHAPFTGRHTCRNDCAAQGNTSLYRKRHALKRGQMVQGTWPSSEDYIPGGRLLG